MNPEEVKKIVKDEIIKMINPIALNRFKDRYIFDKTFQILDTYDIQLGRTRGTRIGTETSQKIGFLSATPIIRQTTSSQTAATFAANSSGITDDTATWGGYTVGDIVAILQAFGLIA